MYILQVYTASHKIGSALLQLGIDAGEANRVGIAGLNSARYIIAQNALMNYSIVLVPLYHNYNMETLWSVSAIAQSYKPENASF